MSSPGVISKERDLTFNVQAITSNSAGYVGLFNWGPVEQIVPITTNESELLRVFGKPDTTTSGYFHAAANYMLYSVPLNIVRVVDVAAKNSLTTDAKAAAKAAILVKNLDVYDITTLTGYSFISRYPGALGNSLRVSLANSTGYSSWAYASEFGYAPADANTFNMVVIDEDGLFTGTPGAILERYELMVTATGAKKADGSVASIKEAIREQSNYVLVGDVAAIVFTAGKYEMSFVDGVDANTQAAPFTTGWDLFAATEQVEIARVFTSFNPLAAVVRAIDVGETRGDAVSFNACELADVYNTTTRVQNVKDYFTVQLNKATSYAFNVDNWKMVYDKYNNRYIWIPCDSDAAGLHARVFVTAEAWYSPAGFNRGQLKNVIKLAWSANEAQRGELYRFSINSIVSFVGEGTVLFGDKTALMAPSAFSRINVRTLFIVMRKSISRAARYQLFEFNDSITQALFRNATLRFLNDIQSRRGIIDKRVVADSTNNTPQVVDSNEFVGDIYVKPSRSINFIRLGFVAVATGVSFEEIEGA